MFLIADATTPTSSVPGVTHLTGVSGTLVLWLTVGLVIAAGVVIAVARTVLEGSGRSTQTAQSHASESARPDKTLIRSWLAISLVGGLLLFCAISFGIDDTTLRSTLIGGLVANAGAGVAFYFASKSSDQARRDILNASLPTVTVPNLIGKNVQTVNATLASMPLHFVPDPPTPGAEASVVSQSPPPNQPTPQGSQVTASFAGPIPDLTDPALTPAAAKAALAAVSLILDQVPANAGPATTAHSQVPAAGATPPPDKKIQVTFE
jgi:hypothetical protein